MKEKGNKTQDNKLIQLWEKMANTYIAIKNNKGKPSIRLILKFLILLLRILLSIAVRKLLDYFFPDFLS